MTAPCRLGGRLHIILLLALVGAKPLVADVANPDQGKPGIFGRIFGGKSAPAAVVQPPAPPPPPKPATTAGPKPKVTTKAPSKPTISTAKKTTPTPAKPAAVAKKEEPAKPAPTASNQPKSESKPEPKPAATAATKDGEFGHGGDDDESLPAAKFVSATTAAKPPPPPTPLPHSQSGGWEIVKLNGRDYITGESIHRFYRFSSYKVEGTHVWLRSNNLILKGQIGSMDLLINNIKFVLSYPVAESNGKALFSRLDLCKLIDPVLRPSHISGAEFFDTVVIDAGHGGHDPGARGVYGYEKDFALKMAFTLKEALMQRGFKVVMSRSTDTFVSLSGRVAISNNTPRSIFVSLHFNSGGAAATGIETFALTPQGSSASLERGGGYNASGLTGNSQDSANIALATAVHAMVISRFKFVDRGIKRAQWSVLTGCKRPGILFEGGFVTNSNEGRLIASDTYRQSVSNAIADAIVNYRKALQPAVTNMR